MKSTLLKNRPVAITTLILVVVGLALGLSAFKRGLSGSAKAEAGAAEPAIVATVEGRDIPAKIYRMYLKNGMDALGLADKTDEGRKKIEALKEGIIAELIDRALIEAEARRRDLSISEEKFEKSYKARVAEMGGEELYRAYLAESGITDEEFRQIVRGEIFGEMLRQELGKEISFTQSEAQEFYNKEKGNPKFENLFKEAERVRASHILINARRSQIAGEIRSKENLDKAATEARVAEEMNKRRARAAAILGRLKAGADFAALARENSDDPGSRDRGGDLGLFTRSTHTAKFDEAAFALKPGQVSGLIETEYGYHIIKVAERKPERVRSFDEVRASIEQQVRARKLAEHLTRWLEARRREADINVTPFYRVGQFQSNGR
ncbi:MAG TPA: peptidylprolyl isomerase [Blastocatellia bacterium]|jgi:parvulin-like peptidyl-prolyl isomerase|nr:peptidylprolyl isomerase [Blastocatellia bacterium]